jgi:sugar phosphate isomerase/epimerase
MEATDAAKRRVGVCSWSLQASTPEELAKRAQAVGVDCVQLALDPLRTGYWPLATTVRVLDDAGLEIRSGMMSTIGEDYSTLASIKETGGLRPDRHWKANRRSASTDAALARALGLDLISFHAGFMPEERGPEREKLVARLREVVDLLADHGVRAAFETGQERAATLLEILTELDRPTAGVNFDPANMLLYDKDEPVDALRLLAPHVLQIHVKDARRTRTRGAWGDEVPVGTGEVDWTRFFDFVHAERLAVDLMIERVAGSDRVGDMRAARERVERELERRSVRA